MLIELIFKVSFGLKRGKIVIYIDRRRLIREMTSSTPKASQYTNDYGAIRSRVDEIWNQLEISILIQYLLKRV